MNKRWIGWLGIGVPALLSMACGASPEGGGSAAIELPDGTVVMADVGQDDGRQEGTAAEFGSLRQALGTCSGVGIAVDPGKKVPAGTSINVTATAESCSDPIYHWEWMIQGVTGWMFLEEGPITTRSFAATGEQTVFVRVKVRDSGATKWQAKSKQKLIWF